MTRYLAVLIVAGAGLAGLPVHAHHPIAEVYDEERTIVLEGDVTSFLFGNPHSMVHLRVADRDGDLHTWAVEWRAASRLRRLGWTAADINVGDRVKMCGNPGRDPGAYRLYLLNVTRILPGAPDAGADDTSCEPAPLATRSTGSHVRPGPARSPGR